MPCSDPEGVETSVLRLEPRIVGAISPVVLLLAVLIICGGQLYAIAASVLCREL